MDSHITTFVYKGDDPAYSQKRLQTHFREIKKAAKKPGDAFFVGLFDVCERLHGASDEAGRSLGAGKSVLSKSNVSAASGREDFCYLYVFAAKSTKGLWQVIHFWKKQNKQVTNVFDTAKTENASHETAAAFALCFPTSKDPETHVRLLQGWTDVSLRLLQTEGRRSRLVVPQRDLDHVFGLSDLAFVQEKASKAGATASMAFKTHALVQKKNRIVTLKKDPSKEIREKLETLSVSDWNEAEPKTDGGNTPDASSHAPTQSAFTSAAGAGSAVTATAAAPLPTVSTFIYQGDAAAFKKRQMEQHLTALKGWTKRQGDSEDSKFFQQCFEAVDSLSVTPFRQGAPKKDAFIILLERNPRLVFWTTVEFWKQKADKFMNVFDSKRGEVGVNDLVCFVFVIALKREPIYPSLFKLWGGLSKQMLESPQTAFRCNSWLTAPDSDLKENKDIPPTLQFLRHLIVKSTQKRLALEESTIEHPFLKQPASLLKVCTGTGIKEGLEEKETSPSKALAEKTTQPKQTAHPKRQASKASLGKGEDKDGDDISSSYTYTYSASSQSSEARSFHSFDFPPPPPPKQKPDPKRPRPPIPQATNAAAQMLQTPSQANRHTIDPKSFSPDQFDAPVTPSIAKTLARTPLFPIPPNIFDTDHKRFEEEEADILKPVLQHEANRTTPISMSYSPVPYRSKIMWGDFETGLYADFADRASTIGTEKTDASSSPSGVRVTSKEAAEWTLVAPQMITLTTESCQCPLPPFEGPNFGSLVSSTASPPGCACVWIHSVHLFKEDEDEDDNDEWSHPQLYVTGGFPEDFDKEDKLRMTNAMKGGKQPVPENLEHATGLGFLLPASDDEVESEDEDGRRIQRRRKKERALVGHPVFFKGWQPERQHLQARVFVVDTFGDRLVGECLLATNLKKYRRTEQHLPLKLNDALVGMLIARIVLPSDGSEKLVHGFAPHLQPAPPGGARRGSEASTRFKKKPLLARWTGQSTGDHVPRSLIQRCLRTYYAPHEWDEEMIDNSTALLFDPAFEEDFHMFDEEAGARAGVRWRERNQQA
uniref:Uncharacterized protein n=1 Tax=Chromera velia CCMP2878 TaxID=1169474 RepID=A0A0G4GG43_9ALVE|eukprot:Cvel_21748.t1-p1 / transcript=Cvel_21748.t1 / gene=Cvel_21748 / organism=Chromera_velia_CCMP2878 / gene_product=hypothetical protein / transcript_product=hypothetical protein / location=Cvel_scaffold2067:7215-12274(+) / protein_length=1047 / sequence_SO=supercontig / SO=protein_coding / is_pseudo=false